MFKNIILRILLTALITCGLYADKLDKVKSSGVLNAGVKYDFKPFGFIDKEGEVAGFDIDLIKYIAKDLGVKARFYQVTSKTRIPMVESSQIDIAAASMTHKASREKTIDFTISYFFDGQSILTRNDMKKRTAEDFAGSKVGAIQGATSGDNFKKLVPDANIVYFQEYPQAVTALKKKRIDAVTTDLVWCTTQAKESKGKLKVVGGALSVEPYGMGVAENESNFRDAVNFALQKAVTDGTYEKLYKKWFGETPKVLPEVWP